MKTSFETNNQTKLIEQILSEKTSRNTIPMIWSLDFNNEQQKYFNHRVNCAYQKSPENPHLQFIKALVYYFGIGCEANKQEVMTFLRKAVANKHSLALYHLATMITCSDYEPIEDDFIAAGVDNPGGDRYIQSAALLRKAMSFKLPEATFFIAEMILEGKYMPIAADFKAANISDTSNDFLEQVASFYRAVIPFDYKCYSYFGDMIRSYNYIPTEADLRVSDIQDPGDNHYQRATAFYFKGFRLAATASLKYEAEEMEEKLKCQLSYDKSGDAHLALCIIRLCYKNDLNKAKKKSLQPIQISLKLSTN